PSFPTRRSSDLRLEHAGDVVPLGDDVVEQVVDRVGGVAPAAAPAAALEPQAGAALVAHPGAQLGQLALERLGELGDLVEGLADLAVHPLEAVRQPDAELTALERAQPGQDVAPAELDRRRVALAVLAGRVRAGGCRHGSLGTPCRQAVREA